MLEKIKQIRDLPHLTKMDIDDELNSIYSGKLIHVFYIYSDNFRGNPLWET